MANVSLTFPDGNAREYAAGITAAEVAADISTSLGKKAISATVDGAHWDGVDATFARLEGKDPGQKKAEVGAAVPFGRMGRASDLTGMAVFLASDEAEYIVAQTYNVDGGQWMS